MSDHPPLTFTVEDVARILGEPARWHLLRELAKGEPMPVKELARRIGKSADMTSKHLAFLRDMGVVMTKYNRIYQLVPALAPAPGATHLDFGHCLVRLE